jgi:ABC-type sugar transport system ATPase subunit
VHNNKVFFNSGVFLIDLGWREDLKKHVDNTITMGIRPESLGPGEGPIVGLLEVVEHIGSETILYVRTDNGRVIAKGPSNFQGNTGEKVSLALRTTDIHLFHKGIRV